MSIIIQLYIIICISLLVFDLLFLLIKNRRTHILYPKNTRFEKELRSEIQFYRDHGSFSTEFLNTLPKKLEKISNLITLMSVIGEDRENQALFAKYVFAMVEAYQKKPRRNRPTMPTPAVCLTTGTLNSWPPSPESSWLFWNPAPSTPSPTP